MKKDGNMKLFVVVSSVAPLLQADGTAGSSRSSASGCVCEGFLCVLKFQLTSPEHADT